MRMKQFSVLLSILSLSLVACGGSKEKKETHEHTYSNSWTYSETTHWHDSTCGHKVISGEEAHTFIEEVVAPTYTSGGYTKHICNVCGYYYIDNETDAISHNFSTDWDNDEVGHWHNCLDKGYEDLKDSYATHTFEEKITPATYEAGGYTTHTCSICGYSYVDNQTAQLEHHYSADWEVDEVGHWHKCLDSGYEDLKGSYDKHDYNDEVIAPTEVERGYTVHTCKICEYSYIDKYTPATGLDYSTDWSIDEDKGTHYHACITEGYTDQRIDEEAHKYGEWETTKEATIYEKGQRQKTCSVCNHIFVEDLDVIPSYNFSVSFAPNWNNKTASNPAEIYIAGSPSLFKDGNISGELKYVKMTYSNGTYSYSTNYIVSGDYQYSLYASSNGGDFNINNICKEGIKNITISKDYSDNSSYSWDEEPGYVEPITISHVDVTMNIYDLDSSNKTITNGKTLINPTFENGSDTYTPSYSGNNIRIDKIDGKYYITALKAGTETNVTLTADSDNSVSCTFKVTVPSSTYKATSTRDAKWASGEGWFNSTTVSEISDMGKDFMNGVDISSCKALYQNGTNFYNSDGIEQSLFYILKDAGVNWIRLKLWVDPYDTNGVSFGGGESDLNNTLWMAYEAKAAGLNFLLDFHYSDYWTHPGQQILPKSWGNPTSASALAALIKDYTKNTLTTFNNNGCLPDMVQLGNEISSGSFLKVAGSGTSFTSYEPDYLKKASDYAYKGTAGSSNMNTYLSAGVEAVNEINTALKSDIKTVVHWAKGSSISALIISNFFNSITADYDYAAISFYPYYCYKTINDAKTILAGMKNITTDNSGWFIAEIAYPFSGDSWVYEESSTKPTSNVTDLTITNWTTSSNAGCIAIRDTYPFTGAGQANLIHDLTNEVVSAGGLGIFYWEPAWVPNAYVGWASSGSSCTYSNQGFFSYDGKAIANINLFAQMSPYIN